MRILTREQIKIGFTLQEDDHCLFLLLDNDRVAVFSALGATPEAIRETADTIHTHKNHKERG
jgi:hypothetical protein